MAWGRNAWGEGEVPPEVNAPGVKALMIAAGVRHSLALIEVPTTPGVSCDVGLCDADLDADGISDKRDRCLETPVNDVVDEQGCSVAQRCPCDRRWERGCYMDCVRASTTALDRLGKISRNQARRMNLAAFQSECGRRRRSERDRIRDRLNRIPNLPDWMREWLE